MYILQIANIGSPNCDAYSIAHTTGGCGKDAIDPDLLEAQRHISDRLSWKLIDIYSWIPVCNRLCLILENPASGTFKSRQTVSWT